MLETRISIGATRPPTCTSVISHLITISSPSSFRRINWRLDKSQCAKGSNLKINVQLSVDLAIGDKRAIAQLCQS